MPFIAWEADAWIGRGETLTSSEWEAVAGGDTGVWAQQNSDARPPAAVLQVCSELSFLLQEGISSCTNSFCAGISIVKASVGFGELIYLQLRLSPLATPSHGIWANLLKLAICTSSIPGFIGSSCLFFLHGYLRDFSRKMWWLCGLLECPVKGQPGGWNFPGHHNYILRKTENVNLIIQ